MIATSTNIILQNKIFKKNYQSVYFRDGNIQIFYYVHQSMFAIFNVFRSAIYAIAILSLIIMLVETSVSKNHVKLALQMI